MSVRIECTVISAHIVEEDRVVIVLSPNNPKERCQSRDFGDGQRDWRFQIDGTRAPSFAPGRKVSISLEPMSERAGR